MAKIRIKRSNVVTSGVAKAPTSTQMDYGELAINYNNFDPVLFIKDSNNDVIRLTGNNLITSVFGRTGDVTSNSSDYASFYAPLAHVGTGGSQHAEVTTTANGFMLAGDKAKLDGITAGAQPNVITAFNGRTVANVVPTAGDYDLTQLGDVDISSPSDGQVIAWNSSNAKFEAINQTPVTNLSTSRNSTTVSVNSSTGTNISIAGASQTNAGILIASDKTKLDGIATNAEVNVQADFSITDNTLDSFIKNKPTVPSTLGDLTDVSTTGIGNNKIIKYNSSTSRWEIATETTSSGTVTSITAGSGLNGGTISSSGILSIQNSYLHSTLDSRYLSSSYVPPTVVASSGGSGGSNGTMTAAMAEKVNGIANNAELNVNADWNSTSGDSQILNKPSIPSSLNNLNDVSLSNSQSNQILQYNGSNWVNSGVTLNELSDVSAGSPSSGQILSYNGSNWVLSAAPSGTTNLGTSTSTSNVTITSSSGSNTAIAVATSSRAGVLDTTLFNKLNGIETGAQVNPTNISAFTNNEGYITSSSLPTNNNQLTNGAGYVTASQCNTVIGTDSDINTDGATVIDQLNMTDGVITSHSTRTITLADLGYSGATNANYVENNNQLTNGAGYVTSSGNTTIGTSNDVVANSGATIISKLYLTNGVVTNTQSRTLTLNDFGFSLVNDSSGNLGIGDNVLTSVSSGERNTGFGDAANQSISSGDDNTAFGYDALKSVSGGYRTTGIGSKALASQTSGGDVVAIGVEALNSHTSPYNCVAIGSYAAQDMSGLFSGTSSVFVGSKAGSGILSGSGKAGMCVHVGYEAGFQADGNNNIGIGYKAGQYMDGDNNIEIGNIAGGSYSKIHNIGSNSNRIVIGNNSSTNAYIKIAWSTTSDARDKMNFSSVPYGLEFVNNLKPISFQFKKEREINEPSGNIRYGFKAQDILSLEGDNPVIIDNEDEDSLKFQSDNLVPVLVNAIQELSAEVSSLKQLI